MPKCNHTVEMGSHWDVLQGKVTLIYLAFEYHILPPDEHEAIDENERLNKF